MTAPVPGPKPAHQSELTRLRRGERKHTRRRPSTGGTSGQPTPPGCIGLPVHSTVRVAARSLHGSHSRFRSTPSKTSRASTIPQSIPRGMSSGRWRHTRLPSDSCGFVAQSPSSRTWAVQPTRSGRVRSTGTFSTRQSGWKGRSLRVHDFRDRRKVPHPVFLAHQACRPWGTLRIGRNLSPVRRAEPARNACSRAAKNGPAARRASGPRRSGAGGRMPATALRSRWMNAGFVGPGTMRRHEDRRTKVRYPAPMSQAR
jgi:hypothetical protein